jgi:hypothetical protein
MSSNKFTARTIADILAQLSSITLGFSVDHLGCKLVPSLGIDPVSLALIPPGERARVDVDSLDGTAFRLPMLLRVLRGLSESLPRGRHEDAKLLEMQSEQVESLQRESLQPVDGAE